MSHRWDCPTDWEARREGRKAGERGYGRNPYDDPFPGPGDISCEEASENWKRGQRDGQLAREEREREEARERRQADERRRHLEAQEAAAQEQWEWEQRREEEASQEQPEEKPE